MKNDSGFDITVNNLKFSCYPVSVLDFNIKLINQNCEFFIGCFHSSDLTREQSAVKHKRIA